MPEGPIMDWFFSMEFSWPRLYLWCAVLFYIYFQIRVIFYTIEQIGGMFWRILWGVIILPIILSILWPIAIFKRVVYRQWVANYLNNRHWWEDDKGGNF